MTDKIVKRFVLALTLALAACGPHSGSQAPAPSAVQACALLDNPAAVFGSGFVAEERAPLGDMAGDCRWSSKDGALVGEIIVYTPASLASGEVKTAQARYDERVASWKGMTFDAPKPLDGVGDEASVWTGFAGGQAQAALRKGDKALILMANSIAPKVSSDALAQRLAKALAAKL